HLRVVDRDRKWDVRAVSRSALAVVLVPRLVERGLRVVRSLWQRGRLEGVDAVAVDILEPRAQTARIPVAGAAELRLEAHQRAGDRDARRRGRRARSCGRQAKESDGENGETAHDPRRP